MPIYEYECKKCGDIHEVMQKIADKPLTKCPSCGGRVHRIVSASSFHLKGTGWYKTDYASPAARPAGAPNESPVERKEKHEKESAPSTSTNTDTATATKKKPEVKASAA